MTFYFLFHIRRIFQGENSYKMYSKFEFQINYISIKILDRFLYRPQIQKKFGKSSNIRSDRATFNVSQFTLYVCNFRRHFRNDVHLHENVIRWKWSAGTWMSQRNVFILFHRIGNGRNWNVRVDPSRRF